MAIKKPDAYLWKPSAILNSPRVEELSPLEELWYRRALDRSFDDEGISADPAKAATRIGRKCTPAAAEKILKIFFVPKPRDPSKVVNPRQEIERKNAVKALKRFSDAGKASGRKRRERKGLSPEQRSNDVATINKQINKDKEEEEKRRVAAVAETAPPEPANKPDDRRKSHPAIVGILEVTGIYPPREIWDELIDRLGIEIDTVKLKKAFIAWRTRGYNKVNYDWTEWYHEGIPKAGKTNGTNRNGNKQTPAEIIANRPYRNGGNSG